jgi:ribonuclease E
LVQEAFVEPKLAQEAQAEPEAEPAPVATLAEPAPVEALSLVPPAPEPAPALRQPELPVITEADPNQPKRSGWWARAKANLTGH